MSQKKASKKFQDGVITVFSDSTAVLYDQGSKQVTKGRYRRFGSGDELVFELGTMHLEVNKQLELQEFSDGSCFMSDAAAAAAVPAPHRPAGLAPKPSAQPFKAHGPSSAAAGGPGAAGGGSGCAGAARGAAAGGGAAAGPQAVHDPRQEGAVLLNAEQWRDGAGRLPSGRPVVPVVLDPYVTRHLRPHQVEGVRFLYEAVMGLRTANKTGAILADEMGLGKTLQIITLAWTLLRQGPEGRPVARKVLVVTPASLVDNWGSEVRKWLGHERLKALCLKQSPTVKQEVLEFMHGHQKLMVTSYETIRKHADSLKGVFDLLVCDEGHRLKSVGGNKTIDALLGLGCPRRIVLTGTPMQNDLQEFYALLSFVVPDVLGPLPVFNRVYGGPITRGQEGTATQQEQELGEARSRELTAKVSAFMLRRTQQLLARHLPPLASLVLYCRPQQQQLALYGAVLRSKAVQGLLYSGGGGGDDNTLAVITALRKVANHPDLLLDPAGDGAAAPASSCLPDFSGQFAASASHETSGKMRVLWVLLEAIAARGERCVVVSTSTTALDLVERLVCRQQGLATVRIDGGTSVDDRQQVVDSFNKLGMGQVFLLSTRAGGAGLNLVGANHLVLYDSDWNPAMDQQAMARIWRDGQQRPCTVYRLLTTGTIEEKVYQRQLMKADLAGATMAGGGAKGGGKGGGGGGGKFTREELKQLFSVNTNTQSDTRDLLPPGRVPGLVWMDPGELAAGGVQGGAEGGASGVGGAGSPLAAAAACGVVSCVSRLDGETAAEVAAVAAARAAAAGMAPEEDEQGPEELGAEEGEEEAGSEDGSEGDWAEERPPPRSKRPRTAHGAGAATQGRCTEEPMEVGAAEGAEEGPQDLDLDLDLGSAPAGQQGSALPARGRRRLRGGQAVGAAGEAAGGQGAGVAGGVGAVDDADCLHLEDDF